MFNIMVYYPLVSTDLLVQNSAYQVNANGPLICDSDFHCLTGADAAEDEEVDVTSVDPIAAFCSR